MSTSSTSTLGVDRAIEEALHRVWGFSSFRPLQREAMQAILTGRDSVVVLPTGGGKSLCFQAPAIVMNGPPEGPPEGGHHVQHMWRPASAGPSDARRGFALVVSPLISLMKDQSDKLTEAGVAAAVLNSALSAADELHNFVAIAGFHSCFVPSGARQDL